MFILFKKMRLSARTKRKTSLRSTGQTRFPEDGFTFSIRTECIKGAGNNSRGWAVLFLIGEATCLKGGHGPDAANHAALASSRAARSGHTRRWSLSHDAIAPRREA